MTRTTFDLFLNSVQPLHANIPETDLVPEQGEKERGEGEASRSAVQRQPKWAPMRSLAYGRTQK